MEVETLGDITLIFGDCMEYMAECSDKAFDLAIVDPPYNLSLKSVNASRHSGSGTLKNRLLNKSAAKFKDWDKAPDDNYFQELFRVSKNQIIWGGNYFDLPPTRCFVCWDKCQPWENFSQVEYAWTSFDYPAKLFRFDNRSTKKIHPTEKPVQLYEYLLYHFAKKGHKILDTHGGSMSHAIAAYNHGYELTIIEKDKEYYDMAKERLINHQKQLKIFM